MKNLFALLLVIVLAVAPVQPVLAAAPPAPVYAGDAITAYADPTQMLSSAPQVVVSPYWVELAVLSHGVTISGSTAKMSVSARTYSSDFRLDVTATLQKASGSSYSTYATYSDSGWGYCSISESVGVSSGTYRVRTVVKVYNASGTLIETVTDTSTTATC